MIIVIFIHDNAKYRHCSKLITQVILKSCKGLVTLYKQALSERDKQRIASPRKPATFLMTAGKSSFS